MNNTTTRANLPAIEDACFSLDRHGDTGWNCIVRDGQFVIHGYTIGATPEKALKRVVDAVSGRVRTERLRPTRDDADLSRRPRCVIEHRYGGETHGRGWTDDEDHASTLAGYAAKLPVRLHRGVLAVVDEHGGDQATRRLGERAGDGR